MTLISRFLAWKSIAGICINKFNVFFKDLLLVKVFMEDYYKSTQKPVIIKSTHGNYPKNYPDPPPNL